MREECKKMQLLVVLLIERQRRKHVAFGHAIPSTGPIQQALTVYFKVVKVRFVSRNLIRSPAKHHTS